MGDRLSPRTPQASKANFSGFLLRNLHNLSYHNKERRHIFLDYFYFYFLVWVGARSLGFRFLGISARFWLLVFLGFFVIPFLGFLATRLLMAFLSCMVCWLLGFLGFLAFQPLGLLASRLLIASCSMLYYVKWIFIYIYQSQCIIFWILNYILSYNMKSYGVISYYNIF